MKALKLAKWSNQLAEEGPMIHLCGSEEICNLLKLDAAELRRLAELNAELLGALESVRLCVKEFGIGQQIVFVDLAISKAKAQQ